MAGAGCSPGGGSLRSELANRPTWSPAEPSTSEMCAPPTPACAGHRAPGHGCQRHCCPNAVTAATAPPARLGRRAMGSPRPACAFGQAWAHPQQRGRALGEAPDGAPASGPGSASAEPGTPAGSTARTSGRSRGAFHRALADGSARAGTWAVARITRCQKKQLPQPCRGVRPAMLDSRLPHPPPRKQTVPTRPCLKNGTPHRPQKPRGRRAIAPGWHEECHHRG